MILRLEGKTNKLEELFGEKNVKYILNDCSCTTDIDKDVINFYPSFDITEIFYAILYEQMGITKEELYDIEEGSNEAEELENILGIRIIREDAEYVKGSCFVEDEE